MCPSRSPDDDPFLTDLDDLEGLEIVAASLATPEVPFANRARLLASATLETRLARFGDTLAPLLDLPTSEVVALLARAASRAEYVPGPFPGIELLHFAGGVAVRGAITGFVRITAGAEFPDHEHLGREDVVILEGHCLDTAQNRTLGPGDRVTMEPGTVHRLAALAGPDLVYVAVAHDGIRVGDLDVRPDDPSF